MKREKRERLVGAVLCLLLGWGTTQAMGCAMELCNRSPGQASAGTQLREELASFVGNQLSIISSISPFLYSEVALFKGLPIKFRPTSPRIFHDVRDLHLDECERVWRDPECRRHQRPIELRSYFGLDTQWPDEQGETVFKALMMQYVMARTLALVARETGTQGKFHSPKEKDAALRQARIQLPLYSKSGMSQELTFGEKIVTPYSENAVVVLLTQNRLLPGYSEYIREYTRWCKRLGVSYPPEFGYYLQLVIRATPLR